jgi:hypothetical protein
MLQLRTTRARILLLLIVLALLVLLVTSLVLSQVHPTIHVVVSPDGMFGGH